MIAYESESVLHVKDDAQVFELGFEWMDVPFNKIRATGEKTHLEEDYHFLAEVEVKGEVTHNYCYSLLLVPRL